jgi:pimeloyl-ACP methyl ester carboxylesterase
VGVTPTFRFVTTTSHLVCVHGLAGSARWWRAVRPALEERHTVELIDVRRLRPREAAPAIEEALDRVERPVLVGHSLGGLQCAQVATRRRDLAKLVLVAPAGIPSGRPLPLEALALAATARTLRPHFMPTLAYDTFRWGPRALLRGGIHAIATDLRVDLASIAAPTLLVWGEHDRLVPTRLAEEWCDAVPNARVALIPDARHVPMVENPSAFAAAVLAFLEEPEDDAGDLPRR